MKQFYNTFKLNNYITQKDKEKIKEAYTPLYLKTKKNILSVFFKEKRKFLKDYLNINKLVEHNNNKYINQKKEEYNSLLKNIKGYQLDEEQTQCVLNEEDTSLVIAGAGSGKTLTIIAKIRYLIETQYIEEDEILCISFTRESSNKLKEDLKNYYNYNIDVCTFHKLALNILKDNDYEFIISSDDTLSYIVNEFYDSLILDYPNIKNLVTEYFFGKKNKLYSDIKHNQLNNFKKIIITFINLLKANVNNPEMINSYLKKVNGKNYLLLLNIIIIYNLYTLELNSQNEIDFDDLIYLSTQYVDNYGINKKYKYIIIDEYQDTSLIRINLIKAIIKKIKCKLMVVGDDFQSIYKFSGCNINTFFNFQDYFPYSKIFYIRNNYRNTQEIVDIAGKFIMKNKNQLSKQIKAHKSLDKPIKIVYYQNQANTFDSLLKYMINQNQKNILILGRNNNDLRKIIEDENSLKQYNPNIKYLTVHKSKGLEEENIIIINLENDIMGFPSKLEEHEIMNLIYDNKESIKYEEERRLFYVALTRSKNYVYLLVNKNRPSIFVKEIINDYPNKIEIISIK